MRDSIDVFFDSTDLSEQEITQRETALQFSALNS
jgi:hypothetical protein